MTVVKRCLCKSSSIYVWEAKYYCQQNILYPYMRLLVDFKFTLNFSVVNLLAHNNRSQVCFCVLCLLQSAEVNYSFYDNMTPLRVPFTLLAMVHTGPNLSVMLLVIAIKHTCCNLMPVIWLPINLGNNALIRRRISFFEVLTSKYILIEERYFLL